MKEIINNFRADKASFILNFCCALLLVSQSFFGIINVHNVALYYSIAIVILIIVCIKKISLTNKYILFLVIFSLLFLISTIINGFNGFLIGYMEKFILFGLLGSLLFSLKIDHKIVFKLVCYLSVVIIPIMFYRISLVSIYDISDSYMSWSYVLFPLLCVSVVSFKFKYINRLFSAIIIASLLFFFIRYGTRGVFISIAILFFGCIFLSNKNKLLPNIILISISLTLLILFINYYDKILNIIINFSNRIGLNSWGLDKMLLKIDSGQIDNGRSLIYSNVFKGFLQNPFGYFISNFEVNNGTHCHNVFLQSLYEFGIVGIVLSVTFLICSIRKIIKRSYDYQLTFVLLICSFGVLIVSSSYWENPFFWFLLSNVYLAESIEKSFVRKERISYSLSKGV